MIAEIYNHNIRGVEFLDQKMEPYIHNHKVKRVSVGCFLFVCGISVTFGQLNELFPDCLKVMLFASPFTLQGQ